MFRSYGQQKTYFRHETQKKICSGFLFQEKKKEKQTTSTRFHTCELRFASLSIEGSFFANNTGQSFLAKRSKQLFLFLQILWAIFCFSHKLLKSDVRGFSKSRHTLDSSWKKLLTSHSKWLKWNWEWKICIWSLPCWDILKRLLLNQIMPNNVG